MTKHKRNYNQDYFKVGGSPQPGEQEMPDQSKQKLTRAEKSAKSRKVPPGAPGTEPASDENT
jgi:hypothetical protein